MTEVQAMLIGASVTAFVMVLSNISNRRDRDIVELFSRINRLERAVSRMEGQKD